MSRTYTMSYRVGNRDYVVEGSNALLQDLCMGEHVRQKQILNAAKMTPKEFQEAFPHGLDLRAALAHGELKGVTVGWISRPAPFTRRPSKAA